MKRNRLKVYPKEELVKLMKDDYVEKGLALRIIGNKYGVSYQTVSNYISPLTKDEVKKHNQNHLMRLYNNLST